MSKIEIIAACNRYESLTAEYEKLLRSSSGSSEKLNRVRYELTLLADLLES